MISVDDSIGCEYTIVMGLPMQCSLLLGSWPGHYLGEDHLYANEGIEIHKDNKVEDELSLFETLQRAEEEYEALARTQWQSSDPASDKNLPLPNGSAEHLLLFENLKKQIAQLSDQIHSLSTQLGFINASKYPISK